MPRRTSFCMWSARPVFAKRSSTRGSVFPGPGPAASVSGISSGRYVVMQPHKIDGPNGPYKSKPQLDNIANSISSERVRGHDLSAMGLAALRPPSGHDRLIVHPDDRLAWISVRTSHQLTCAGVTELPFLRKRAIVD